MKEILCPECGGSNVMHYTDVYVLRTPVFQDDGTLGLVEYETEEYAEFFKCQDCGHRPTEAALLHAAA